MSLLGLVNRGWLRLRAGASAAEHSTNRARLIRQQVPMINISSMPLQNHAHQYTTDKQQETGHRIALSNSISLAQFSSVQNGGIG